MTILLAVTSNIYRRAYSIWNENGPMNQIKNKASSMHIYIECYEASNKLKSILILWIFAPFGKIIILVRNVWIISIKTICENIKFRMVCYFWATIIQIVTLPGTLVLSLWFVYITNIQFSSSKILYDTVFDQDSCKKYKYL